jgi:hypothetical protein
MHCRKDGFLKKLYSGNWISTCRRLKHPCLSPCTNINLKKIKDLNVRPGTEITPGEKIGNVLEHEGTSVDQ